MAKKKKIATVALQRPDHKGDWIRTLDRCVGNGLLTQEERDEAVSADSLSETVLQRLKDRLIEKAPSKIGFAFAWESLQKQLVKAE